MKNVEVLVSTMNRSENDFSLYNKMNIHSNSIIINQAKTFNFKQKFINGNIVKMYTFPERGVGKSRNNALMRAQGDICVFADDDMVYVDNYEEIILNAYRENPDADFIIFNARIHYPEYTKEIVRNNGKVHFYNILRYGTVSFTFKRDAIMKHSSYFPIYFGPGAKFSSGEDSLFLWKALKNGAKIYSNTSIIADVYNYSSSWFTGYTNQYLYDKGALAKALSPSFYNLYILYTLIKSRKQYDGEKSMFERFKIMKSGAKEFSSL